MTILSVIQYAGQRPSKGKKRYIISIDNGMRCAFVADYRLSKPVQSLRKGQFCGFSSHRSMPAIEAQNEERLSS